MSQTKPTPDPSQEGNKQPDPPSEDTTILHLQKFAPGRGPTPGPSQEGKEAEEGVTAFIQKAAAETAQQSQQPIVKPSDAGALPPKEMLGAISYSYAKGVFRSEDIERKMNQDPAFRQALGDQVPDAKAIRRFRKLNREAILTTLAKAFRLRRKKAAAETLRQTLPGAEPAQPAPNATAGTGETTILSRNEAEQRLENAAWIDNMSKED